MISPDYLQVSTKSLDTSTQENAKRLRAAAVAFLALSVAEMAMSASPLKLLAERKR